LVWFDGQLMYGWLLSLLWKNGMNMNESLKSIMYMSYLSFPFAWTNIFIDDFGTALENVYYITSYWDWRCLVLPEPRVKLYGVKRNQLRNEITISYYSLQFIPLNDNYYYYESILIYY